MICNHYILHTRYIVANIMNKESILEFPNI